jgi:hypothetical protein
MEATPTGMRAAIECLPFENPKLSAAAIGHFDGKTFAEALERCIERSKSPPLLNGPVEQLTASELKRPMSRYRRVLMIDLEPPIPRAEELEACAKAQREGVAL